MLPQILLPYTSEQFFSYSPQHLTPHQELEWVIAIADAFPGEDAIPNNLILCARHVITHLAELQAAYRCEVAGVATDVGMCYNFSTFLKLPYFPALEKLLEVCFGGGIIPFNSPANPYAKESKARKIWHNPMRIAFTEFLAMQPLAI